MWSLFFEQRAASARPTLHDLAEHAGPAAIHTVANTGDQESAELAPDLALRAKAECSETLICFRFSVRETIKKPPLAGRRESIGRRSK
jgi:hypothetical protein